MTALKRVVAMRAGGTPTVDDPSMWDDDGLSWVTIADMSSGRLVTRTTRRVSLTGVATKSLPVGQPGTLLFAMYASVGAVGVLGIEASWNQAILGIDPRPGAADATFIRYWLEHLRPNLNAIARSNTQDNLNAEQVGNLPFPILSLSVQQSIAGYLDRETARIDALIAAKQRMQQLTRERLEAFAQLACIGHVGKHERQASPSGIYGLIPNSWTETSLRHLGCEVQTGPFGSQLHAEEYTDDGWPVVNPTNLVDGRIVAMPNMMISPEKRAELSRHVLAAGDIVFGRRGEMGRAGLVGPDQAGWVCGTGSLRLRLNNDVLVPEYLKLLLQTPPVKAYFSLSSVGSTMENLNSEVVLAFPTLVPSRTEQIAIVEEIQQASGTAERFVDVLHQQVDLLRERRHALITAAVMGQLDIPEAA